MFASSREQWAVVIFHRAKGRLQWPRYTPALDEVRLLL